MPAPDTFLHPVDLQLRTDNAHERRIKIWDSAETVTSYREIRPSGHQVHVLLAEDNLIDQISIRRLLEKTGADVKLAGDGRQAADLFECGVFDVVLLDILMPHMDGFDAAVQIREKERSAGSRIPLIALTSYSLKAVYDKCMSVSMSGYLSKPIARGDLRTLFAALQLKSLT
jgi:CheY-like chemotaxis protein